MEVFSGSFSFQVLAALEGYWCVVLLCNVKATGVLFYYAMRMLLVCCSTMQCE